MLWWIHVDLLCLAPERPSLSKSKANLYVYACVQVLSILTFFQGKYVREIALLEGMTMERQRSEFQSARLGMFGFKSPIEDIASHRVNSKGGPLLVMFNHDAWYPQVVNNSKSDINVGGICLYKCINV
jgi:hypothetical protein